MSAAEPASETTSAGILYTVATPIGNLDDISTRAVATLKAVDLILCEDTRRTGPLLAHFGITTRRESFHEHNEQQKTPRIVEHLQAGDSVALVSDAGTPLISDPGYRLVQACVAVGVAVVPIPGASAVTALLSVSGLPTDRFYFAGFLPPKGSKRNKRLTEIAAVDCTIVLFESAQRLKRTLSDLHEALGDRQACVGRELTKKFEEIRRDRLSALLDWVGERTLRGEITLALAPADKS